MEDTLRYFFSSVFQGIAALFALGAMFYISYADRLQRRKEDIEIKAAEFWRPTNFLVKNEILKTSTIEYIVNVELPKHRIEGHPKNDVLEIFERNWEEVTRKTEQIKSKIFPIIKYSIWILILSIVGLFLVGYSCTMNYIMFFLGIILIYLIIDYLIKIFKLLKIVL